MGSDALRFRTGLKEKLPQMLALIERLVNIDSGSHFKPGVNQVGEILAEELSRSGFEIQCHPMTQCGDQVVGFRRLNGKGRLLILGHADTVWPEGTARDWRYTASDGYAKGPGVGDMKGGLVMAIYALRELLASGFDALESIRFFIVPDEELGSIYSRPRIEAAAREADWALVLEPGRPGGGVVTARGAVGAFFMHAHGKTAHCATNYRKGASAVRELSLKVPQLEALSEPDNNVVVNVGVFQGGAARQVVPGEAKIDIDVRARTVDQAEALLAKIKAIASDIRDERVGVDLTGQMTRPPFTTVNNRALFRIAMTIANELGITLFEVEPSAGGSDGNFAAALNVPTLDGLGPVSTDVCSREETISVASLADRGALLAAIIQQLAT
jgi:glutamate carboxypeptidase